MAFRSTPRKAILILPLSGPSAMARHIVLAVTAAVTTLAACQHSRIEPPIAKPAIPVIGSSSGRSTPGSIPTTWTLTPAPQHARYRVTRSTSLAAETRDTLQQIQDSLRAVIEFSLNLQQPSTVTPFEIEVTSLSTSGNSAPQLQPLLVTGHIAGKAILLDEINGSRMPPLLNCSDPHLSYLPTVEQVVLIPPIQLHVGMQWTDSITLSACAGLIPASFSLVRQYQVIKGEDRDGGMVVILRHEDLATVRGSGSEGQHSVRIEGTGIGIVQSALDAVTGALIQSKGTRSMTFTVTASGQSAAFTQLTTEDLIRLR